MSTDVQLGWNCPHIIAEERVSLSADRRSLVTQKPIVGTGLFQMLLNDTYVVSPTKGLQSSATLSSAKAQPYLVSPGLADFTIKTQSRTLVLALPTGYSSATTIATLINNAVFHPAERPFLVASVSNGVLTLTENLAFGASSQVHVSGNAAEGLGFLDQVGAVGQQIIPPFNLYNVAALGAALDEGFFVKFDAPIRPNYYFSITYTVIWNQCLRCRGTEVENDWRFNTQGATIMIVDENLLYQSVLKILLTELKSNIYYPWYGADIANQIGSKSNPATANNIQNSIRTALSNLQAQQAQQSKYQRISPKERLYSVDNVAVRPSPQDPTVFLVDVSVRNYSFDPINITIVYTAPGAFALPGTNRLTLGSFG
jgi:hypothetical protein